MADVVSKNEGMASKKKSAREDLGIIMLNLLELQLYYTFGSNPIFIHICKGAGGQEQA